MAEQHVERWKLTLTRHQGTLQAWWITDDWAREYTRTARSDNPENVSASARHCGTSTNSPMPTISQAGHGREANSNP